MLWRRFRGVRSMLVSTVLLLGAGELARAADLPVNLGSLRGAWLERFTRFVDWPNGHRVNDPKQPFGLCVVNDADFADLLQTLYSTQTIKGKAVRVSSLDTAATLQHCDLVFLAEVPPLTRNEVLATASRLSTLVVSASDGYAAAGSHINLYEEEGYLRFEVNLDAVHQAGLGISSHLLKIARVVRRKEAG